MTPTWTGKAGEPVPAMLRHDLVSCGERQRRCTRCERCWWLDELPDPMALCPVAVATLAGERDAVVAYLRECAADTGSSLGSLHAHGMASALSTAADAIEAGRHREPR